MTRWKVGVILPVAALCLAGCIFDPDKDDGDPQDLLATPAGVVVQLANAYQRKDIDLYLECLVDTFEFHLVPRDVNDIWPAPSWGKVEEERMHRKMFSTMDHIELTMVGDYATRISDDPETWRLYRECDLLVWETADQLFEKGVGYFWAEFVIIRCADNRFRITDLYDLEQEP